MRSHSGVIAAAGGPASLSGLQLWLRADAGTFQDATLTTLAAANNDPVGGCTDWSFNGLPFTNTGAARPLLKLNIQNGLPGILTNGSSQQLLCPSFQSFPSKRGTIFLVWRWLGGTSKGILQTFSGTHPDWQLSEAGAGNGYGWYDGGSSHALETFALNRAHILVIRRTGDTTLSYNRNALGPATFTVTNNQHAANQVAFGGDNGGTGEWVNAYYFELGFYDRDIGDANEALLFSYLNQKWQAYPTLSTIYSGGKGFNAYPTVVKTASGKALVEFTNLTSGQTDGQINLSTSTDNGNSWATAVGIRSEAAGLGDLTGDGMVQLASGKLLVPYCTTGGQTPSTQPKMITSTDGGATWSAPASLPTPTGFDNAEPYGRILEVTPGNPGLLLMPMYAWNAADAALMSSCLMQSTDAGATWTTKGTIAAGVGGAHYFDETAVITTTDSSHLVACVRDDYNGYNGLWTSTSADGGATWAAPSLFTAHGISPDLIRLANGDLLLVWGNRNIADGQGIWGCVSTDNFATQTTPIRVVANSNSDVGYPSAVQLPDGSIGIAYYDSTLALKWSVCQEAFFTG